jgi:hypothetical protein
MYTPEDGVIRLKYVRVVTTQETCLDGDLHQTVKLQILLSLFSDAAHEQQKIQVNNRP